MNNCPDCKSKLSKVKIIDATASNFSGDAAHTTLKYAAPDADQSFFTGKIKSLGEVRAHLCVGCGRMFLYAIPNQ